MSFQSETPTNPACVAVVGAGVMGADVALDLALHHHPVVLKDVSQERLNQARARIEQQHRLVQMMRRPEKVAPLSATLERIVFVTSYDGFSDAAFVIENVTEALSIKEQVYQELKSVCHPDAIFGVNTSCISITRIAGGLPVPGNVIGMHFLNPVPLKALVEVIRGHHTSSATVEKTRQFLKTLGKRCVVVNDAPGFVTNRVLMVTINEAAWVVHDGISSATDVDTIFKVGFAHKMGPLATADLIGLDTILDSLQVLQESYGDPKYRPCPLLRRMVDAGLLGRKSGCGFFNYGTEKTT